MPEPPVATANVRAVFFYVLRTSTPCVACGSDACVLAIALPEGHEVIDESATEWSSVEAVAVLSFVAWLPADVSSQLQDLCAGYRPARAQPGAYANWANHCSQCAAEFDEEALHSEPDVAFLPFTEVRASRIEVHRIDQTVSACARGVSIAPQFFDAMSRA